MPGRVVVPFDEDESFSAKVGCMIEFAFGWRDPLSILVTVVITEKADIDGTLLHLMQIDLIGSPVGSRQVFEEKYFKKPAQQRVTVDILFQRPTVVSQFLLDRADEELFPVGH